MNENLQRSFMKNAVQYFDVMSVRATRRKRLADKVDEKAVAAINQYYLCRYPGIFVPPTDHALIEEGYQSLGEKDTKLPITIFLDYDCNALLMACLAILPEGDLDALFPEVSFRRPVQIEFRYDLRQVAAEEDAIRDIRQLIQVVGTAAVTGLSAPVTEAQFDFYELNYLAATITLDLTDPEIKARLSDTYYGIPLRLFEKLYKIQLLGVKAWQGQDKKQLRNDAFMGNVKKPLKTRLPLAVTKLQLANQDGQAIDFDDLSDGEAQLIQVLAASRIFRDDNTLYIFDEPETHLNPSWRTHFHQHLSLALHNNGQHNSRVQMLLSTHSPFLVSSLHQEDVLRFVCQEEGSVQMEPVTSRTFGASFEGLIKKFFGLNSLISQTAVEEIKRHLAAGDDFETRGWIEENLGDSMEKAYLLRKLID